MMARLTMADWVLDGKIEAEHGQFFENQLYRLYKP